MRDKFEHISFHLKKVEELVENQMADLSTSLQKYVSSITDSQENKIDAKAAKIATILEEYGLSSDSKVGIYLHNSNERS